MYCTCTTLLLCSTFHLSSFPNFGFPMPLSLSIFCSNFTQSFIISFLHRRRCRCYYRVLLLICSVNFISLNVQFVGVCASYFFVRLKCSLIWLICIHIHINSKHLLTLCPTKNERWAGMRENESNRVERDQGFKDFWTTKRKETRSKRRNLSKRMKSWLKWSNEYQRNKRQKQKERKRERGGGSETQSERSITHYNSKPVNISSLLFSIQFETNEKHTQNIPKKMFR